jgi:hypothetical protein
MVFMASTGHFGHGFLGSGRDWITQHPQIGCMTIEHFGCNEWEDLLKGSRLFVAPCESAPDWNPTPIPHKCLV